MYSPLAADMLFSFRCSSGVSQAVTRLRFFVAIFSMLLILHHGHVFVKEKSKKILVFCPGLRYAQSQEEQSWQNQERFGYRGQVRTR